MKKDLSKKSRNTKAAIAATIMAVPAFGMPSKGIAQEGSRMEAMHKMPSKAMLKYEAKFEKMKNWVWLAGVGDGHTVYQNERSEFFYIDPMTGDMKFLSADYFYKGDSKDTKKTFVMPHILEKSGAKVSTIKMEAKVSLLGVDDKGNVIQENAKGEKFYLSPTNGDMIYVK